jgi:hypothetical protein
MLRKGGLARLAVAAMSIAGLPACGDDAARATATGTTATTAGEPSEVPEGVAAQYAVLEEEIAAEGASVETGDWRIAYIEEPAEGWFQMDQGHPVWRDPAPGETAHLEIIPIGATVQTPRFLRHGDESEAPALMDDAQVEFEQVRIDVGA